MFSTVSMPAKQVFHVIQSFTNQLATQLCGVDCMMMVQMMVAIDNS